MPRSRCLLYVAAVTTCVGTRDAAKADALTGPLILKDSGSFFVGGQLASTDAISTNPHGPGGVGYSNSDYITTGQMYVQFQVPKNTANKIPIIMIHGCCLTAKSWEDTPDGRMGWSEYFVRKNHPVYLPDQSSRGRSGFDATTINEVALGIKPPSDVPAILIFGRNSSWDLFRFGARYPLIWPDEQFPMEAVDELSKQVIPDENATLPTPNPTYANVAQTAVLAGGAVVIGHSQSGVFPELAVLTNSSGIRGMVSIEPLGCAPLDDGQVATLSKIPVLFIFGDHVGGSDVSKQLWPPRVTDCQAVARQINAVGGSATFWELPKLGLHGNSHLLMMDLNNLQIADMILHWIQQNVDQRHGQPLVGKNRNLPD